MRIVGSKWLPGRRPWFVHTVKQLGPDVRSNNIGLCVRGERRDASDQQNKPRRGEVHSSYEDDLICPARLGADSRLRHCVLLNGVTFEQHGQLFIRAVSAIMEQAIKRDKAFAINLYFSK